MLKGFSNKIQGLASSYSTTGDIILIGKSKDEMMNAFHRMVELGGGIVISEERRIVLEIPLPLSGVMSDHSVERLVEEDKELLAYLKTKGYTYADPIYTLLFFSSTHLPYIRITQQGMYDVMNKMILFPTIMR